MPFVATGPSALDEVFKQAIRERTFLVSDTHDSLNYILKYCVSHWSWEDPAPSRLVHLIHPACESLGRRKYGHPSR